MSAQQPSSRHCFIGVIMGEVQKVMMLLQDLCVHVHKVHRLALSLMLPVENHGDSLIYIMFVYWVHVLYVF